MPGTVLVVGSTNIDLIVRTDRLPRPGETVLGGTFLQANGGKGANQAVAAARAGAIVRFLTAVGKDDFGRACLEALRREGIDTACVHLTDGAPTGAALIVVDAAGENSIVVAPGANSTLVEEQVEKAFANMAGGDRIAVCTCQLEIPLPVVGHALRMARERGVATVLNPAPACPLDRALLENVDYLTPNEAETEALTGIRPDTMDRAKKAGRALLSRGVGVVIVTRGEKGAYLVDAKGEQSVPAPSVDVVDSTAAGDAFNGAFSARLAQGEDARTALPYALCAGSLAVTRQGAQPSIPDHRETAALQSTVFDPED